VKEQLCESGDFFSLLSFFIFIFIFLKGIIGILRGSGLLGKFAPSFFALAFVFVFAFVFEG
jgi:hypothetical protein